MLRTVRSVLATGSCLVLFSMFASAGCVAGDDVGGGTIGDAGKGDTKVTDTGKPPVDSGTGGDGTSSDTPVDDSGCTPPSGKVCAVYPQCGCASSEKCDVTGVDGTTSCLPDGTLDMNERCDKGGSCLKGFSCVGSICRPFCSSDASCAGTKKGVCHSVQGGTPPADIPGFKTCFIECDPLAPSKTCGASGCGFLDATTTTCSAAGTGKGAGGCGSSDPNGCAPGYVCLSTGECRKWCRMTGSDCTTGACGALSIDTAGTHPTWKGTEYGVCPL